MITDGISPGLYTDEYNKYTTGSALAANTDTALEATAKDENPLVGDTVTISDEAKALSATLTQKVEESEEGQDSKPWDGTLKSDPRGQNDSIDGSGMQAEGASPAGAALEALQKQLEQAKERLAKAQQKLARAQASAGGEAPQQAENTAEQGGEAVATPANQATPSTPSGVSAEVQAAQQEVEMAQQEVQIIQQEIMEAQQEQNK